MNLRQGNPRRRKKIEIQRLTIGGQIIMVEHMGCLKRGPFGTANIKAKEMSELVKEREKLEKKNL